MTFLKDGRLEASNNRAERAIKTVVIGRKNYLFSTSLSGAEANAIIYSIIETAKEHGLNIYKYLTYLGSIIFGVGDSHTSFIWNKK
ncbi:Transposase IS66 family [Turicibacter sanguinis]|nr:Transposase IS66 family [Turicibacter sanguinis]